MAYTVPASPLTCQVRDAPCQLLFRRSLDERHPQGLSDRHKRARSPSRGIEFRDKVSRCFADREDVDPRKSGYLAQNAKLLSARSVHPLDSPRSTLGWRRPANDRANDGVTYSPMGGFSSVEKDLADGEFRLTQASDKVLEARNTNGRWKMCSVRRTKTG